MPSQKLRLIGAVFIGLASMLGAGVFVVFRDSYSIAGSYIFLAIGLAALVAVLNATSVYRLAKKVSKPGGVYAYSRVYLNDTSSFVAGFAFVFGKTGSIAAIALVFQEYVAPNYKFWPAAAAVVVLTIINILGIKRTAAVAAVLAISSTAFLSYAIFSGVGATNHLANALASSPTQAPLFAVVQSAAIIFFAFAGYARVATLGDEVTEPTKNIPRAIAISLGVVLAIYLALAFVLLANLGTGLAHSLAPVAEVVHAPRFVSVAAATLAGLGSMLALLAGVSRTAASMSEDRELPRLISLRNSAGSPWVAEVAIAAGAIALVSLGDVTPVIGFSSFSVLLYYAIGHVAAWRQSRNVFAATGFLLCVSLMAAVPGPALVVSPIVIVAALVARTLLRR
jgi:APA family basic amino acid/polyamine antiporter